MEEVCALAQNPTYLRVNKISWVRVDGMKLEAVQWIVYWRWLTARSRRHEIQRLARERGWEYFGSGRKNCSPVPVRHPKILRGGNITSLALGLWILGGFLLDNAIEYFLWAVSQCRSISHTQPRVPRTRPSRDDAMWERESRRGCNSHFGCLRHHSTGCKDDHECLSQSHWMLVWHYHRIVVFMG